MDIRVILAGLALFVGFALLLIGNRLFIDVNNDPSKGNKKRTCVYVLTSGFALIMGSSILSR